jgi:repressor LexA
MMMARKRSTKISERQWRILEVLDNYQATRNYPPSIRDICNETGISSTSVVNYYLDQLEEMGLIERDGLVARGIRMLVPLEQIPRPNLMPSNRPISSSQPTVRTVTRLFERLIHIPVAGTIAAGTPVNAPSETYLDPDNMVSVVTSNLPGGDSNSKDLFALKVRGDSMIDAMVNDGDLIILKPTYEARNGEMVAVWLNDRDETTLKYYFFENGKVRLQPANPTMEPIYIEDPATVQIQGKVVMVIRQFGKTVA